MPKGYKKLYNNKARAESRGLKDKKKVVPAFDTTLS